MNRPAARLFAVLCVSHAMLAGKTSAEETLALDWNAHALAAFAKARIDAIKAESALASRVYDGERAKLYLEFFVSGMDSATGAILLEGEQSQWLEVAYQRGYLAKELFIRGWTSGAVHRVSREDVCADLAPSSASQDTAAQTQH